MNAFTCTSCKRCLPGNPPGSFTPGYGQDKSGRKYCYACCAMRDAESMVKHGRATLYLQRNPTRDYVTNWPASLRFPVADVYESEGDATGIRCSECGGEFWVNGPEMPTRLRPPCWGVRHGRGDVDHSCGDCPHEQFCQEAQRFALR